MTVRRPADRIASSRIYRLRESCLEDWLAAGGDRRTFDIAWPGIQAQLLPHGAHSPAIAAGRALGVMRQSLRR